MSGKDDLYANNGAQALSHEGVDDSSTLSFIQPPRSLPPTSASLCYDEPTSYDYNTATYPHINGRSSSLPVIDLQQLDYRGDGNIAGSKKLQELRSACQTWGFFHLVNHGFPEGLMNEMMEVGREFFQLPENEKMRFFEVDPSLKAHYGRHGFSSDQEDGPQNWRELLYHPCYPLTDELLRTWPDVPPRYREIAKEYCDNARVLALKVLALLSESLGLRKSFLDEAFKDHAQVMITNFFPPCSPQPGVSLGLCEHTDPNGITFVQHDDVPGLEVLRDGSWYPVQPIPNAFVVNIGDQLQILSNGKYKSIEHRTLKNSKKVRISIASFFGPSANALIAPASELVDSDGIVQYQEVVYGQYLKEFYGGGLKGKHVYVDAYKVSSN